MNNTTKKHVLWVIGSIGLLVVMLALGYLIPTLIWNTSHSSGTQEAKEELANGSGISEVGMTTPTTEPTEPPLPLPEQIKLLNQEGDTPLLHFTSEEQSYDMVMEQEGMCWNPEIFYGVDQPSQKYKEIPCTTEARCLGETGRNVKFLVYRSMISGNIVKISTIETLDTKEIEQIDYYYTEEGKVNFIFHHAKKKEYTPSHATRKEAGERYYYDQDAFVRFRMISADQKVDNYTTLHSEVQRHVDQNNGNWYWLAKSDSIEEKKQQIKEWKKSKGVSVQLMTDDTAFEEEYKQKGSNMLKQAYQVYQAVTSSKPVNVINGRIMDQDNNPLAETSIRLFLENGQECLWEMVTDSNGAYVIFVPSNIENTYRLEIVKDGYASELYYGIAANIQTVDVGQGYISLFHAGLNGNVTFSLHNALGMEAENENTTVYIRKGINNKTGQIYDTIENVSFDDNREIALEAGNYTLEIIGADYENSYKNIQYNNEDTVRIPMCPKLDEGEIRIVLEWGETPHDLDSHLFMPEGNDGTDYQSEYENPYHICYLNPDNHPDGSLLDIDKTDGYGPETITIKNLDNGTYHYYVADYTNCSDDNPTAYDLSYSGATVDVYMPGGKVKTFYVPKNRAGVIWEVFKIKNKEVIPVGNYYDYIEDKQWWHDYK